MNSKSGIIAMGCALVLLLFICGGTATAQGSGMKGQMMSEEHGKKAGEPAWMPMWKVHKEYLGAMSEVNDLLAEAQKDIEAGNTDKASAKITEAQEALKKRHETVHKHMEMTVKKMQESGDEKGAAELNEAWHKMCPMVKGAKKSK